MKIIQLQWVLAETITEGGHEKSDTRNNTWQDTTEVAKHRGTGRG